MHTYITHKPMGQLHSPAGLSHSGLMLAGQFFWSWLGLVHVSGVQLAVGESRMALAGPVGTVLCLILQQAS